MDGWIVATHIFASMGLAIKPDIRCMVSPTFHVGSSCLTVPDKEEVPPQTCDVKYVMSAKKMEGKLGGYLKYMYRLFSPQIVEYFPFQEQFSKIRV